LRFKRSVITEEGAKVPAYIVTYSDMVTLLLTFFVMLLSLAQTQDPELVNVGRDSFVRSLRTFGLGMLLGRKEMPAFGEVKLKHSISPPPDKGIDTRIINAYEERTERIFTQLSEFMKPMPSQIVAAKTVYTVTDIRFLRGDDTLSEAAKKSITKFCLDLSLEDGDKASKQLYVLGLANDASTEKEQWLLSARRAGSVAGFLQRVLGSSNNRQVYYWGAGPGGDWVGQDSPISEESQVLIAVLKRND